MTATNHAATGALLAVLIKEPLLAVPLAYISHFAMDALPHAGPPNIKGLVDSVKHWTFKLGVTVELLLFIPTLIILFHVTAGAISPWLLVLCMLAADFPDIMWIPTYVYEKRHGKEKPLGKIASFHGRVQYHQYWGIVIEISWLTLMLFLIFKLT